MASGLLLPKGKKKRREKGDKGGRKTEEGWREKPWKKGGPWKEGWGRPWKKEGGPQEEEVGGIGRRLKNKEDEDEETKRMERREKRREVLNFLGEGGPMAKARRDAPSSTNLVFGC
ncbi:hypothetical protein Sjap_022420 [Stephania japonica]|uniref:Uncharacterized protein n=1 Tax=Stephania japonica TaxID=461633 RepID=A0AAP0EW51_9MAGN